MENPSSATGTVLSCRVAVAGVVGMASVFPLQCFVHLWSSLICFPLPMHTPDLLKITFPHLFIFHLPFLLPSMLSP